LTGLFLDQLVALKRIVDAVVTTIPKFFHPTLKHSMSLVPDPASNEGIVGLAKARMQQYKQQSTNVFLVSD